MATTQYRAGYVILAGCLLIILLSADFFIPMRQLGSFFHIAMNGMAASDKIFRLLDLPEGPDKAAVCPEGDIVCENLTFSYKTDREILHGVNLSFPKERFVRFRCRRERQRKVHAVKLFMRFWNVQRGNIRISEKNISEVNTSDLRDMIRPWGNLVIPFRAGSGSVWGLPGHFCMTRLFCCLTSQPATLIA